MTIATPYPVRKFEFAEVYNVVDGDTVDISLSLGFNVTVKHRFRLARIDTPERGKLGAIAATEFLRAAVLNRPVTVISFKLDKYGRYLAEIEVDGVNVNDALLSAGLAKLYE